jgi:arabinofuranosyltransferase
MRSFTLKYFSAFLVVCLATWLVWTRFDYSLTGVDDANIFFIYARNLANGYGFVYNAGGEKVEGFTSLLWTLICAIALFFSSNPEFIVIIVNISLISLGVTFAIAYIQSVFVIQRDSVLERYVWPLVFLVLLVTSPAYMLWNSISLMENALWSTLLLIGTILVIQENISSRVINLVFIPLSILLLLTRPESLLWVSIFTGILLVRKIWTDRIWHALKELLPLFLSIVVTMSGLTVFRLSYFGYPLPNTYYAKVSPSLFYNFSRGIPYFIKYFISNPIVTICILAAILAGVHTVLVIMEKKYTDDGRFFLPVLALVGLLAPVVTGGDHFTSFRFYQSVYPILLLCLFYFVNSVLPHYIQLKLDFHALGWPQRIFVYSLALLLIVFVIASQARDWFLSEETEKMSVEFELAKKGRDAGLFLAQLFTPLPELPKIGVVRAGGIKYTYPGEVIDLMGLNNLLMAHNGGDRLGEKNHAAFEKSTFYELQPDLVSAEIVSKRDWQYQAIVLKKSWDNTVALKGLYDDSTFLKQYVYAKVERKDAEMGKALVGWFRKQYLEELGSSGDFHIERYKYPNG